MSKLSKDFGVSGLIATLAVSLGFATLIIGMLTRYIDGTIVAVAATAAITAGINTYLTVKAVKQGQNGGNNEQGNQ